MDMKVIHSIGNAYAHRNMNIPTCFSTMQRVHRIHVGYIALCMGYIVFDTFHIAGYIALCTGYMRDT
ncbi:hypothetical protein H5410_001020 [Solanum commersonii]|uniref:Uncharacterized protein n=1 Tax=Solanum commersonii TaxID=4109 RepID=A0A9J6AYY5_SOLCO|nr:hypothetical protein H5410_001020 [Solanum commersonii]